MVLFESMISVIAPPSCAECGNEGSVLCKNCTSLIEPLPIACYKCSAICDRGICDKCKKLTRLDGVFSACLYSDAPAKVVRELKYGHNRSAVFPIVEILHQRAPIISDAVITSVPTSSQRMRARSFDHTKLIAKNFATKRKLAYFSLLSRIGNSRQVGAHRELRTTQLIDKFWVTSQSTVKNQKIILIDDVITTGSTVDEIARVLKRAGAKKVVAYSFAHKKLN